MIDIKIDITKKADYVTYMRGENVPMLKDGFGRLFPEDQLCLDSEARAEGWQDWPEELTNYNWQEYQDGPTVKCEKYTESWDIPWQMYAPEIIYDAIDSDAVAAWLTADFGDSLGVYADGFYAVGQDVGKESAENERPIARVKCPGIGNVDSTDWTADWITGQNEEGLYLDEDGNTYTLAECIRECCDNGDVTPYLDELREALQESLRVE